MFSNLSKLVRETMFSVISIRCEKRRWAFLGWYVELENLVLDTVEEHNFG